MTTEQLQSGNAAEFWQHVGGIAERKNAPLYARLAFGLRDDTEIQKLCTMVRPGQLGSTNLLASVYYLLRRGAEHPLKAYYGPLGGTKTIRDGDPYPLFRDFCIAHKPELASLISTRTTNINEIGRCAILHAGFRTIAQRSPNPLHLIEIGPSAGLNLLWDRYRVEYRRDEEVFTTEARNASITIPVELRGDGVPPLGPPPQVARRVGLELTPVDLSDPEQSEWLKAQVWPEQPARLERMERAMQAFAAENPEIRVGDALINLPNALREVAPSSTVCVYHTFSIYQFSTAMKARVDDILIEFSADRPVWRLNYDGYNGTDTYPVHLTRYEAGAVYDVQLAMAEHTGLWLDWRGDNVSRG